MAKQARFGVGSNDSKDRSDNQKRRENKTALHL
ncbi:hypothetical protein DSM3645_05919 [Blastopirellula marina DSM 3645]|uniref:Uncharacterized protein n=1 Tax=Blastopirellula marina DSM 3645 TaxID=314230 RepID=A4A033_9BACT|nr:hypothetical protein DSM3645_05919 [Blastopirellula marina DSM 3645]